MKEKMYVASSEDYGRDEQSAMVGTEIPRINFQHGCAQNLLVVYLFGELFFDPVPNFLN